MSDNKCFNKAELKAFSVEMLSRCTGSLFQSNETYDEEKSLH